MTYENTWIEAFLDGKELEQSVDRIHWFPVIEEPSIGHNVYFREKKNDIPRSYSYRAKQIQDCIVNQTDDI